MLNFLVIFLFIAFVSYFLWRGWNKDYRPRHPKEEDQEGGWFARGDVRRPIIPRGGGGGGSGYHRPEEEPIYVEAIARELVESADAVNANCS